MSSKMRCDVMVANFSTTIRGYFAAVKLVCRNAAFRCFFANFSRAASIAGRCSTAQS
jgi:hypothetical protein